MPHRLTRVATLALCVLPALGMGVSQPHGPFVASFNYACEPSHPMPHVRTLYTAAGRPTPRAAYAPVEVFEIGKPPARKFLIVGAVQVLASSGRTSVSELTEYASRGARKLGGDAIVDVSVVDAASAQPKAGDVGLLYLTASVARWE